MGCEELGVPGQQISIANDDWPSFLFVQCLDKHTQPRLLLYIFLIRETQTVTDTHKVDVQCIPPGMVVWDHDGIPR